MDTPLSPVDLDSLRNARELLENPGLAARMTNLIGAPVELGLKWLPEGWRSKISDITQAALRKATDAAIVTLDDRPGEGSSNHWHKLGAAVSGGVGGFFGLAGLAVELPISTTLMMRSIADIARSEGESLGHPDARRACLEVFALGGKTKTDDATDSGYYAIRVALAQSVAQATEYLGTHVVVEKGTGPALVRLITVVADRFGVQVTEKAAAQAIPALGAAGGAVINTLFIGHFQSMARGHFTVRRLERKYGAEAVRAAYMALGEV
ncbi:MAG TPA: EcsC family protein [Burkholderiaceae bacterium]|nr:EcsC family protein [Burkholderiaceae bacterium]